MVCCTLSVATAIAIAYFTIQDHCRMAENVLDLQPQLLENLKSFTEILDQKIHLLATDGDEQLAQIAAQVTKQLFDLGEYSILGRQCVL